MINPSVNRYIRKEERMQGENNDLGGTWNTARHNPKDNFASSPQRQAFNNT